MQTAKTEKILLILSSIGLLTVVPLAHLPIQAWPYCVIISVLLSIVISSLLQRAWRYKVQKKLEGNMSEKINQITKKSNRYRQFLNQISEGLVVVSNDGICKYSNFSFCSITGLVENEVTKSHISKIISCDIPYDKPITLESILWNKNKNPIPILISTTIISRDRDGEILICITDLQEVKKLEKTLQKSKELSSVAFDSSKAAIFIIDAESHNIIKVNESACSLTNYTKSELIGQVCNLFVCPYNKEQCVSRILHNQSFSQEEEIIKKDGSKSPVLRNASIVLMNGKKCIFETVIDISKRKKAEELIINTQRLESIITLASGIAHEFNNINNIMNSAIDILFFSDDEEKIPPNIKESLKTIKKMIERGATITNDLMIFTSDSNDGFNIIYPLDIIEEVLYDFQNEIEEYEISIQNTIPKEIVLSANRNEIKSVFINLLSNAIHSLIDAEEKIITISCIEHVNGIIEITIADTGCGISQVNLNRIFEPFFGTKGIYAEPGSSQSEFESRGLGLSVCHTILEKHHDGKIDIFSEPGKGTRVVFKLHKSEASREFLEDAPHGNYEKILLFEKDEDIRNKFKSILEKTKYITWATSDQKETIQMLKTEEIDILIIDASCDYLTQSNFYRDFIDIKTKPYVIAISTDEEGNKRAASLNAAHVIKKPLNINRILWAIYNVLRENKV